MGSEKPLYFLGYILLILIISLLQLKRTKERENYFLAGRKLNSILIFFTILSTSIGSSSTILLFFLVSKYGFWGTFLELGGGFGLLVLGIFFARKIRETGSFTLPQILGLKFGEKVRIFSSFFVIIAEILWLSLIFKALQTIVSFNPFILYPLIFSFILSISIGGQWALALTDLFYGLIIFFGFFISYFFNIPIRESSLTFEKIEPTFLIFLFLSTFLPHIAGSDIWGKILSSKDKSSAKLGTIMAGFGKIFWAILIFLIILKFKIKPDGDNTILNYVFSFSKPLGFILILSLFSALLSSANSLLLTASTIFSNDIIKNFKNKKTLTLILGLISFGFAHFSPDILFIFKKSYSFFSISLSIPAILSLFNFKMKENILIGLIFISGILAIILPFLYAFLISILLYFILFLLKR